MRWSSKRVHAASPLARRSRAAFDRALGSARPDERRHELDVAQELAGASALAEAYRFLQQAVGLIAVTLPLVVMVGHLATGGDGVEGSISDYFYTHLGPYFVGALCALGVFFLSYNHRPLPDYELDNVLSNVAGVMAVGVALFPTAGEGEAATGAPQIVSTLHAIFAGILFVLLAVFCLHFFTKGSADPTPQKRRRNGVYRLCGWTIVAALTLVIADRIVETPDAWHTFLWLETVMVVAFGISWLVKGEFLGLLADPDDADDADSSSPVSALDDAKAPDARSTDEC